MIESSLSENHYVLHHSETEPIQGINVSDLEWESEDEFVAMVSDGVIKGQFVGKTNIGESEHGLSFTVEVKPEYNLYDAPDMNWGASMASIKNRYGTPYRSDSDALLYESENPNAPYYMYVFENGFLSYSYVIVPLSAASLLVDFLSERYMAVEVDTNKKTAYFSHCYGKISSPDSDYAVGFEYNSSLGGFLVCYAPVSTSAKSRNVDILKSTKEFLSGNNIIVE